MLVYVNNSYSEMFIFQIHTSNSTVSKLIGVKKMLNLKVTQTKVEDLKENYFRLLCIPS